MLHVGLDLSRTRLDVHVMDAMGVPVLVTSAAPDTGGWPRWCPGWVSSVSR
jgi:transposase